MRKITIVISILMSLIFVFSACKQNPPSEVLNPSDVTNINDTSDVDSSMPSSSEEQKTDNPESDGDAEDKNVINVDKNLANTPPTATVSLADTYLFHQNGVMMQYSSYGYNIGTMYKMSINILNDSGSDIVAEIENLDCSDKTNATVKNKHSKNVSINLFDINEYTPSVKLKFSWRKADEKEMSHTSTVTLTLDDFTTCTLGKYNKNGISIDEIGTMFDEKESVVYLMLLTSDTTCKITISNIVYTSAAGEKNAAGKEIIINAEAGKKYTVPIVLYDKMVENEIIGHLSFDINDGKTTETYSEDVDTGIF